VKPHGGANLNMVGQQRQNWALDFSGSAAFTEVAAAKSSRKSPLWKRLRTACLARDRYHCTMADCPTPFAGVVAC